MKIICYCMSNISAIIARHNNNKLLLQPKVTEYRRNCRVKNTYPLQNEWQTQNLICRADVESEVNDETKTYFVLAATTFKQRFGKHKKDFNLRQHFKNTELPNNIYDVFLCVWQKNSFNRIFWWHSIIQQKNSVH